MSTSSWTASFNPDQIAVYFIISLATTALPAYLYHGVYSADISQYSLVYILVILSSSVLLTLGYKQSETNAHLALTGVRSAGGSKKAAPVKASSSVERVTTLEAQAWAVFVVNALYSGLFLFLAFYVLKAFDVPYDFAASSVVASALAWQIGTAVTK